MQRRKSVEMAAMALGFVALTAGVFAQAPAGRGAGAPAGQGQGGARGAAGGRGAADAATRPAMLWREEWKQPPYTGELNDANRRVTEGRRGSLERRGNLGRHDRRRAHRAVMQHAHTGVPCEGHADEVEPLALRRHRDQPAGRSLLAGGTLEFGLEVDAPRIR